MVCDSAHELTVCPFSEIGLAQRQHLPPYMWAVPHELRNLVAEVFVIPVAERIDVERRYLDVSVVDRGHDALARPLERLGHSDLCDDFLGCLGAGIHLLVPHTQSRWTADLSCERTALTPNGSLCLELGAGRRPGGLSTPVLQLPDRGALGIARVVLAPPLGSFLWLLAERSHADQGVPQRLGHLLLVL